MNIKSTLFTLFLVQLFIASCAESQENNVSSVTQLSESQKKNLSQATFAGGCFWCVEAVFERVEGVKSVVSGYAGGSEKNPDYNEVSAGNTTHAEAVTLYFDSTVVDYKILLKVFFATHDPTTLNRQGPDVGAQYRSIVFYHGKQQEDAVRSYISELGNTEKFENPIITEVVPFEKFYEAEAYHQNYYAIHPNESYTRAVTRPKVKKFEKEFKDLLKEEYK